MGVDVEFKARFHEPPSKELLDDLLAAFREAWPADAYYSDKGYRLPDLEWTEDDGVRTLECCTLSRYYAPGHERGPWPEIRAMGDWLAVRLGELAEVRYGCDSDPEWENAKPWPDARRENDRHWAEFENRNLRDDDGDVVVNVATQIMSSAAATLCGYPTASGTCRHRVGRGRQCAAGHPRR
jgi:hypothetical protein